MTLASEQWAQIFDLRDGFVEEYKGRVLFPSQREFGNKIIESVLLNDGKTLVGEFSRQTGKTTIVTDTIDFLFCFYFEICKRYILPHTPFFNVGFFAPQIDQSRTDFDMLRDAMGNEKKKAHFGYGFSEFNGNTINLNCSRYPSRMAYCFTASPTSNPESKTLNLIIYEESQDLNDFKIDKSIAPMGATTNATEVFIGVGGYQRCRFWQHIEKLPKENKVILPLDKALMERDLYFKKFKNPIYLNYRKHIEKRGREIGEDSDEYKTQYLLKWILERGQFITYGNLMDLEKEYEIKKFFGKVDVCYGGIDWGKMHDSTTFTIVDSDLHIMAWHEWQGDDYSSQIEDIKELMETKYIGMKRLNCDSTSTQDMAVDVLKTSLRQVGHQAIVNGINFDTKTKDLLYKNLSRLMHDKYLGGKVIESAKLWFPVGFSKEKEKFIKQFLELQKDIRNNRWVCNHPEGPNYHDDYCDSLALAVYDFKDEVVKGTYTPSIY